MNANTPLIMEDALRLQPGETRRHPAAVSLTAPMIESVVVRDTEAETRRERLDAVFNRLRRDVNPFRKDFEEYEARLDTGEKASKNFKTPGETSRQTTAIRKMAGDMAAVHSDGKPFSPDVSSSLFLQIAGRVALTAKWYEALEVEARSKQTEPRYVLYLKAGLPIQEAKRFFDAGVPPNRARELYGMIYPETIVEGVLLESIPYPEPVPEPAAPRRTLRPMQTAGRSNRGKKRR